MFGWVRTNPNSLSGGAETTDGEKKRNEWWQRSHAEHIKDYERELFSLASSGDKDCIANLRLVLTVIFLALFSDVHLETQTRFCGKPKMFCRNMQNFVIICRIFTPTARFLFGSVTHIELKRFRPLSNYFVPRRAVIVHLVLEQVVASWSVTVMIESHRCSSTPYEKNKETKSIVY